MKKTNTRCLALSAMLTAVGVVILLCGSFLEVMELSIPAVASLVIAVAVLEMNRIYALAVCLATDLLAFLLLPNKTVVIYYAILFGLYPIVKSLAESKKKRRIEWTVKFFYCAVTFAAAYFVLRIVLAGVMPVGWLLCLVFALGVVTFVLYDFALSGIITQYIRRIQRRLHR